MTNINKNAQTGQRNDTRGRGDQRKQDDQTNNDPRNVNQTGKKSGNTQTERQKQGDPGRNVLDDSDDSNRGQYGNVTSGGRTQNTKADNKHKNTPGQGGNPGAQQDPMRHSSTRTENKDSVTDEDTDQDQTNTQLGGNPTRNDDERKFNNANKSHRPTDTGNT